jgi:hypothetical protein
MSKRKLAVLQDGTEPKYFYSVEISNMVSVSIYWAGRRVLTT